MHIAPHSVSQLLDQFARDELRSAPQFPGFHAEIPEPVMRRLHEVVAKAYTMGYEDGYGVAGSQAQYERDRDYERAEQAKAAAAKAAAADELPDL